MVKVKICGITNIDDAVFCSQVGANALGFIFYKRSPRYITPSNAKKIIDKLGPFIVKVGVFVDEDKGAVSEIANYVGLDVLQFHGKESQSYCFSFLPKFRIIKTFFLPQFPSYSYGKIDTYLFDIRWEEKQKRKRTLPKEFLKRIKSIEGKKIIISGGLTPRNVLKIIKTVRPYAVDVCSGVENFPGKKDRNLVRDFINKIQSVESVKYESS